MLSSWCFSSVAGHTRRCRGELALGILILVLRLLGVGAVLGVTAGLSTGLSAAETPPPPSILIFLADDLGYGDVRCFNSEGRIATPHWDRLAAEGMRFTDAHTSSSVCTPTRYSLLTGRYNWRSRLRSGVQGGLSPRLIEEGRLTLASLLQRHGYRTACVGKWHLGMDWPLRPGEPAFGDTIEKGPEGWRVDFSQPIARGPQSVGFDEFFGISGSLDMVPYAYIHNDRVTELPTVDKSFAMMLGRSSGETRRGPAAASFEAADVLATLTQRAIRFLESQAAAPEQRPFLLYLPFASPHTPTLPTAAWQGRSQLNAYGDFVMETDDAMGQVLAALDRLGLASRTLVIATSDNGCSPQADIPALQARGHRPSHVFRGHKADIFEGGHRVPLVVRWPGRVAAGSTSARTIGLFDILATVAEALGETLPENAGEDSVSFLPTLLGQPQQEPRVPLIHHSINGSFAIRQGDWKLALCPDSGGWSAPVPGSAAARGLPPVQLYNLREDIAEQHNVQHDHPEIVRQLRELLDRFRLATRSAPLPPTGPRP